MGPHEVVALLALAAMVGTVLRSSPPLTEAVAGTLAVAAVLLTGTADLDSARREVAALVGVDVGSNLSYAGSLANVLWRRTLKRVGTVPGARDFTVLGLVSTVPAVLVCTVTLWAWAAVAGVR